MLGRARFVGVGVKALDALSPREHIILSGHSFNGEQPNCRIVNSANEPLDFQQWQKDIARWEPVVERFEELDRTQKNPDDAILFVGSSSIRLWKSIQPDMAPYPVIRRGYGGKVLGLGLLHRPLILPHKFRAAGLGLGKGHDG